MKGTPDSTAIHFCCQSLSERIPRGAGRAEDTCCVVPLINDALVRRSHRPVRKPRSQSLVLAYRRVTHTLLRIQSKHDTTHAWGSIAYTSQPHMHIRELPVSAYPPRRSPSRRELSGVHITSNLISSLLQAIQLSAIFCWQTIEVLTIVVPNLCLWCKVETSHTMGQPEPTGVRFTTNCFAVTNSPGPSRDTCILTYSKHDEPLDSRLPSLDDKVEPVLEVITDVQAAKSGFANGGSALRESNDIIITDTRSTSLVVRSKWLVQTIKDVVKFYPR